MISKIIHYRDNDNCFPRLLKLFDNTLKLSFTGDNNRGHICADANDNTTWLNLDTVVGLDMKMTVQTTQPQKQQQQEESDYKNLTILITTLWPF